VSRDNPYETARRLATSDSCPCGRWLGYCHVEQARILCGQRVAAYTEGVKAERDLLRSVITEIATVHATPGATNYERVQAIGLILNAPRTLPNQKGSAV
jgi:hypothetical protein